MIYPKLQNYKKTEEKLSVSSIHFTGDCLEEMKNALVQYSIPDGNGFTVKISLENQENAEKNEEYFINIRENEALIKCFSPRGAFRGAHTLMKLVEKNELYVGEIHDYPLFKTRGYIEGFYGETWEQKKRLSVMSLMAKYGLNTFYYAPKDDLYHREKWREMYPEKEQKELKDLFCFANKNEFDFYWCIGPGLTYHYTDKSDFRTLINKIKSVYSLGIRNFGLLLDDIPWDFQYEDDAEAFESIADAHVELVNDLYGELKAFDKNISLTVCPTEYFGDETAPYIKALGQNIPKEVNLFWTGQEICSRVLKSRDTKDFIDSTNHKPLFWDNYPVNDCEMFNEMHLGAIRGRDKNLYEYCDGLISNVMEYAECSKIPLMTIADYLWNPVEYNEDLSLENAHRELLGDKADSFKYIADHLHVSCLNRNGASALMSDTLHRISFLMSTGKEEQGVKEFSDYIEKNKTCLNMLKDTSIPLFAELGKWVEKFELCCRVLEKILETQLSPTEENKEALATLLEKYNRDAVILAGFCLREAGEKTLRL